jgi:predicted nucleic acid-binding protein
MVELLAARTQAGEAIAQRLITAQALYAPYVLDAEVISALLGLRRGKKITGREADAALCNYRAVPIERHDVLPLWPRIKSLQVSLSA